MPLFEPNGEPAAAVPARSRKWLWILLGIGAALAILAVASGRLP